MSNPLGLDAMLAAIVEGKSPEEGMLAAINASLPEGKKASAVPRPVSPAHGPSPIRRRRRTKAEMDQIRAAMYATLAADHPMTVRQVFYALTTQGVIAKTEPEYKSTVCRLLAELRRSGDIPYHWLADSTRWMRKPTTYSSAEQALKNAASTYRRALWDGHPECVEIWLEKEALAGVLVDVTAEWDVPLMVTRGYPSMSFLHSAAEAIQTRAAEDQHTHIYYFGDRDPSGVDIDRAVVHGIGESLRSMAASLFFEESATFTRVAVNEEQIEEWNLPSRPTKRTDSRSKGFVGESVELDSIPSNLLRQLAAQSVEDHVDQHQLQVLQKTEAEERRLLEEIAANWNGGIA
jgi:hypothetical protein